MHKIIIHYDLDGVLADFDGHYENLTGVKCGVQPDGTIQWADWSLLEAHPTFFRDMLLMPEAMDLWMIPVDLQNEFRDIKFERSICSAKTRHIPLCKEHKFEWCLEKLPCCTLEQINIVDRPKHKPRFVSQDPNTTSVLIDDRSDNIEEWIEAGGVGYVYNQNIDFGHNTSQIIHELDYLINSILKF
jgi:hypothetical protein